MDKQKNIVPKTTDKRIAPIDGSLSISSIADSQTVIMGEIVAALKAKNSKKLLAFTERELKAGNAKTALFAVLCWFYLLSNPEQDINHDEEDERESWEKSDERITFLHGVKKACEYFNEAYTKNHLQVDTTFFEKQPEDFFVDLMKVVSDSLLEEFWALFVAHGGGYHTNTDDRFMPIQNVIGAFLEMFADNNLVPKTEIDKVGKKIGEEFLDSAMVYVFERESILNPSRSKAYNQAMRLNMYRYLMHLFVGNYYFDSKVRQSLQERIGVWVNIETYIKLNLDLFKKTGPKLFKKLPHVVTIVQNVRIKEPRAIWILIKDKLKDLVTVSK